MTPWCDDLVCSWRRLLADRHLLPFPWTLSLHRRWCPSASHHPVPFLCHHASTVPLPCPFLSGGGGGLQRDVYVAADVRALPEGMGGLGGRGRMSIIRTGKRGGTRRFGGGAQRRGGGGQRRTYKEGLRSGENKANIHRENPRLRPTQTGPHPCSRAAPIRERSRAWDPRTRGAVVERTTRAPHFQTPTTPHPHTPTVPHPHSPTAPQSHTPCQRLPRP